jgi:hypothetical protein
VSEELLRPDWPVPGGVHAAMTLRPFGDVSGEAVKAKLRGRLPAEPAWLRQVHGTRVVEAHPGAARPDADASFARSRNAVCVVMAADCMPVLLASEAGDAVAAAHAGWRGLCAGVIEATIGAMQVPGERLVAWLGPAIGPAAYEVGDEVREAVLARDAASASAFAAARPGHWMLDLYAVARQRLAAQGVARVHGGGYCTFGEPQRFFSYRRDKTAERMAALVWIA